MNGTFIGVQPFFNDAVDGAAVDIKPAGNGGAAGQLHFLRLVNTTAAVAYLQVFNLPAAGVTLGTTTPKMTYRLGANETLVIPMPMPLTLGGTGISAAGTTTPTGNTGAAISVAAHYE